MGNKGRGHCIERAGRLQERASGVGVAGGERNFHVLYQLLAGADVALLSECAEGEG